ncbi:MAG: hypothetical protein ACKO37_00940 [Vampirovibrionales bacterium]
MLKGMQRWEALWAWRYRLTYFQRFGVIVLAIIIPSLFVCGALGSDLWIKSEIIRTEYQSVTVLQHMGHLLEVLSQKEIARASVEAQELLHDYDTILWLPELSPDGYKQAQQISSLMTNTLPSKRTEIFESERLTWIQKRSFLLLDTAHGRCTHGALNGAFYA